MWESLCQCMFFFFLVIKDFTIFSIYYFSIFLIFLPPPSPPSPFPFNVSFFFFYKWNVSVWQKNYRHCHYSVVKWKDSIIVSRTKQERKKKKKTNLEHHRAVFCCSSFQKLFMVFSKKKFSWNKKILFFLSFIGFYFFDNKIMIKKQKFVRQQLTFHNSL